jgi:hypothetical protein
MPECLLEVLYLTLDEIKHRHTVLSLGAKTMAIEQLTPKCGKEALTNGIVIAAPN